MKLPNMRPLPRPAPRPADDVLLEEIISGLMDSPKWLHPKFLYDARGSALFDRICELPEYYLTRTETSILRNHAPQCMRSLGPSPVIVELGSGASLKTRILLDAVEGPATYIPVDISRTHLKAAAQDIARRYPRIEVLPVNADFTQSFALPHLHREAAARTLVFFPGSTIGNFHHAEAVDLLRLMARLAGADGLVMVGVDLRKDPAILERAYDDAAGVTAAFNRNVLVRLNEEFGADFDLSAFEHRAPWVEKESRIEMHLICHRDHAVHIGGHRIRLTAGESILTESCHKYGCRQFAAMAGEAGLQIRDVWLDPQGLFSVQLLHTMSGCVPIH